MNKDFEVIDETNSINKTNIFSTASWWILVATIGLTPVAVGMIPFGDPFLWSWKFVLHNIVLLSGVGLSGFAFAGAFFFEKRPIKKHWSLAVVFFALLMTVVSTIFADDRIVAVLGDADDLLSAAAVGALGLLFFLTVQLVDNRKHVNQLLLTFIASGTVMALVALSSQLFQLKMFTPVWADVLGTRYLYERGGEIMGNPDAVGVIIAMCSIILLWRVVYARSLKARIVYGTIGVIVTSATILTLQRAAWVGLVVGFIFVLAYALKTKHLHIKHAGVLVLAIVLLTAGVTPFFNDAHIADKLSTLFEDLFARKAFSRVAMYGEATNMIADHPFVGVGPANYRMNWFRYRAEVSVQAASGYYVFDPHSLPFFVAASFGLPVFFLLCALVGGSLFEARRLIRSKTNMNVFVITSITLLVGILMSSVNPASTTFLMYITLLCAIPIALAQSTQKLSQSRILRIATIATVILVGVFSIAVGVTQFIGYGKMDQAQQASTRLQSAYEFLNVGVEYPYIVQSSQIGIRFANDEVVESRSDMHPDVHKMILVTAEMHPNDFMTLREVSKYLINYGAVTLNNSMMEQGLAMAEKAIKFGPYDSQLYLAYITGLANAGRVDDAKKVAADYLNVVPKDGSIRQLAINLENVKQGSGAQW